MSRFSVINGNGCTCDCCHTILYSSEAIKLKFVILADSTGKYNQVNKKDLCNSCYHKLLKEVFNEQD